MFHTNTACEINKILLFFLILPLKYITAIEIVSIGEACNVARAARHNEMRNVAYPFDWLITPLPALKNCFRNNFSQILISDQICERNDHKAVIDGNGLVFIHDFPTIKNPIAPADGEIMPVHELTTNWRDSIEIVQAKFERRLQRLQQLLNNGKPTALVRYNLTDHMDRNDAQELIEIIKQKHPNARIILVVIGSSPDFKESWNLPHICNLYIDEKKLKSWDGPEWAQIMHKINALSPQKWSDSQQGHESKSYLLTSPCYGPGLFSVFNTVLGALDAYDRGEITGLSIDFKDKGFYFSPSHGNNWWNYYFEPIALGNESEFDIPKKLFPTYQKIIFAYQSQFKMSRERANELIQKYIHLKPHVMKIVDDFYDQYFKNAFVIGVHYRGTDKQEATYVSYETINTQIQNILNQLNGQMVRIFVATDDTKFATYIKAQFPNLVVMRQTFRSDTSTGVHIRSDFDPYKKGEEAIVDCLLLSRCNTLIKMASNLSDCSLQFSPHLPVIKLNISYSE